MWGHRSLGKEKTVAMADLSRGATQRRRLLDCEGWNGHGLQGLGH